MRYLFVWALTLGLCLSASAAVAQSFAQSDADATVRQSEQVLAEIMAMPGKAIPEYLLSEAQGVVIVPNVIKIGFIAGVRRGHGVVMVRDAEGEWSLPQFVTLTGGSVGWQAGIQGTDVVLVFTTAKGVQGLMQGKFTIGADASVSAGPVGRNAAAGTDATLKSEILSYSRSRGLFLGVAIDGSVLEIDGIGHAAYYGSPTSELPRQVPDSAIKLRQFLVDSCAVGALANGGAPVAVVAPGAPAGAVPIPPAAGPPPALPASRLEAERRALVRSAQQLQAILKPEWQQFLALPKEVYDGGPVHPELMNETIARYERVSRGHEYQQLSQRPEFQTTYDLLRQYSRETAAMTPAPLNLPPPPASVGAAPGKPAPR
jgi:lipid-binding SYLF domain-containing protein